MPISPLAAELNRWSLLPFVWGQSDCCLILADWICRVTGRDPAAAVRGLYDTPQHCEAVTGFLRDPVGAVERQLASIGGLPRVAAPQPGDVAVLRRLDSPRPFGGLWTGGHWAGKAERGVTILQPALAQPLAIWGVGYAG